MPHVEEYGFYFGILAVCKEIEEGVRGQNIFLRCWIDMTEIQNLGDKEIIIFLKIFFDVIWML